jgi:hypothetical protein
MLSGRAGADALTVAALLTVRTTRVAALNAGITGALAGCGITRLSRWTWIHTLTLAAFL